MIEKRLQQVGIDRLVRLAWLERAAGYALSGDTAEVAKSALREILRPSFQTGENTVRGSLDKTLTILMKIWFNPPQDLKPLRKAGLNLLARFPEHMHKTVHWGMVIAAYPFWGNVALQTGRLLRLQDSITPALVQRRLREQYGERELVSRRVRYVLRSFMDWDVLQEPEKGIYSIGKPHAIDDPNLIAWLLQTSLAIRSSATAPLGELIASPLLFPFRLASITAGKLMQTTDAIEVLQHGVDDILLKLR